MDKIPFTQRFFGAVLVTVVGGLLVHSITEVPRFATLRALLSSPAEMDSGKALPPAGNGSTPAVDGKEDPDLSAERRTVADVLTVGTAMLSWISDQSDNGPSEPLPSEDTSALVDLGNYTPISRGDLYKLLVPSYLQSIPRTDGWGHPFAFYLNVANPWSPHSFAVRSPGRDGKFSGSIYRPGRSAPDDPDEDIVWTDGYFVQWPNLPKQAED